MRIFNISLLLLLAGCLQSCQKESSPFTKEAEIDKFFEPWNSADSPGAAVAVMKDGDVIFKKGYGMANLEYDIPITPSSIFHIASESKQYTAFCIVLLAQEGKLSLDDDIRKYLSYVPDFGKTITIKQLIHHTSGLRDQWQLLAIGGQSLDDVITQQHIIKLVENQKELNFEPGTQQRYCNTGYTLLAEIVKEVSGQSLREYANEKIFKPLGMTNTHFHDDNREIIANRTYSYDSIDNGKFSNSPLNYATVGATSLFTTVEDELKWLQNYETGQVGGKGAIDQMYDQAVLTDGTKLDYAFAINIDTVNGYVSIGHGGADAGYRTYAVHFPQEKLNIVVFSNLDRFNPTAMARKIANLYLPSKNEEEKIEEYSADSKLFPFYAGSYISDEGALDVTDSSKLSLKFGNQSFPLTALSDTSFSVWGGYAVITFKKKEKSAASSFTFKTKDQKTLYQRYEKPQLTKAELVHYVGTYESDELQARYHIVFKNGKLILRHRKYKDVDLKVITDKQFSTPLWWMDNLIFSKDSKGNVTGFEVNGGRVLHLKFRKL